MQVNNPHSYKSADDLLIKDDEVNYQFQDDELGIALEWEWEGCGGRLWFRNEDLVKLSAWLKTRSGSPPESNRDKIIEECAAVVESRAGNGPYAESMGAHRVLTSAADAIRALKNAAPQGQTALKSQANPNTDTGSHAPGPAAAAPGIDATHNDGEKK